LSAFHDWPLLMMEPHVFVWIELLTE
jgi:hypothetical protein